LLFSLELCDSALGPCVFDTTHLSSLASEVSCSSFVIRFFFSRGSDDDCAYTLVSGFNSVPATGSAPFDASVAELGLFLEI
jgi:hypothetical protein